MRPKPGYEYLWICGGEAGKGGCYKVIRAVVSRKAPTAMNCPECADRPAMRLLYTGAVRR
jgi:hypothetical protein